MRKTEPRPQSPERARSGFTLLEVLAAALILALWFTVLAGSSFNALRAEGESLRVLEAGMLADRQLAQAFASTMEGSVPEAGEQEAEEGPYIITTIFGEMGIVAAEGEDLAAREDVPRPLPGAAPTPDMVKLLADEIPGAMDHLRSIKVTVSWEEGERIKVVERASFVFDAVKAAEVYESGELDQPESESEEEVPEEEEEEEEE